MSDARILLKYSVSNCNKELLQFLHQNIGSIKKRYSLKVIVVYDSLIPKLGNTIKKLPVLIVNGNLTTGNTAIRQLLVPMAEQSGIVKNSQTDKGDIDLENYWNKEMHSGMDNDMDDGDDLMDAVKRRALDQSQQHRESNKKQEKKREPIMSNTREENIKLDMVSGGKISDMVDGDPMMQKFWENQESTPGF